MRILCLQRGDRETQWSFLPEEWERWVDVIASSGGTPPAKNRGGDASQHHDYNIDER